VYENTAVLKAIASTFGDEWATVNEMVYLTGYKEDAIRPRLAELTHLGYARRRKTPRQRTQTGKPVWEYQLKPDIIDRLRHKMSSNINTIKCLPGRKNAS